MKKLLLVALFFAWACNSSQKTTAEQVPSEIEQAAVMTYAETITEAELKDHLYTYASDEFEGRETGTAGQQKAVDYIKEQYQKIGIPAAKKNGDYFQNVPLEMSKLPSGTIEAGGREFAIGKDFLSFNIAEGSYDEILYVGYGIADGNYSDYQDLDVQGKIVLIKFGEPKNEDGSYRISGNSEPSVWSNMSEAINKRSELAGEMGAKGVLYYDPVNYSRFKSYYEYMETNHSGSMSIKNKGQDPAMVVLNTEMAIAIYPDIEKKDSPATVKTDLSFHLNSSNDAIKAENVVAFLKGSEKPDEYIIISSHLDHIGITADGKINNGADDDGSGTVAMFEIAEAFKKAADAGKGPKRSLVFLHVTGEEKGLLGSQYYTDVDPIFPLSQTVADLNIDMIGRIDPKRSGDRNYVYLIGSDKLSSELHKISEEVNKKYTHMELDYTYNDENDPNRFYYRSDHYNFAKNNIPIIFYFNGTHDDYHRPGDTPDKINYDLLKNRAQLVFYTAWELANREQRIAVDKETK